MIPQIAQLPSFFTGRSHQQRLEVRKEPARIVVACIQCQPTCGLSLAVGNLFDLLQRCGLTVACWSLKQHDIGSLLTGDSLQDDVTPDGPNYRVRSDEFVG